MGSFQGGSAYAMSRDIADGFTSVTERTFRNMSVADLGQLAHEIDRYLRELRGSQTSTSTTAETQTRGRRIQRLNGARAVLQSYRTRSRR